MRFNAKRFKQVVAKSRKSQLTIELWDKSVRIAGATLPETEPLEEYPSADGLSRGSYDVVAAWNGSAAELATMLERTCYCCDTESSRYALGIPIC